MNAKFLFSIVICCFMIFHKTHATSENEFAEDAFPIYSNEDRNKDLKDIKLMISINSMLEKKQYDEARKMLDSAIAAEPNNAYIYFMLGILEENLENHEAALTDYRKAVELDPLNAQYKYDVGRVLCNKAFNLVNAATKQSQDEYQSIRDNQMNPLFREAAGYLEEVYKLNPDGMRDAASFYLILIYSQFNDQANLTRIGYLREKLSEIQKLQKHQKHLNIINIKKS